MRGLRGTKTAEVEMELEDKENGDVIEGESAGAGPFSNVGGTISSYYKVEVSYDMLQFAVN